MHQLQTVVEHYNLAVPQVGCLYKMFIHVAVYVFLFLARVRSEIHPQVGFCHCQKGQQ